jgi:hypothetical protein
MARRSVTNDRYRVEQKGKTRKSASSAKPKREAGSSSASTPAKKAKPKSKWGRGPAREPIPKVPTSPEMKQLRRYWWILIGTAIVLAVAMIPLSKMGNKTIDSLLFGVYAASLGGALYLEFGPLRKARLAAIAEAKGKGGKASKAASKAPALPTTPEPQSLQAKMLAFFVGKPKTPGSADPAAEKLSDNETAAQAAEEASGADGKAE